MSDPDEFRAQVRPANCEYLLKSRGAFSGTVIKIDLHNLRMQRLQESLPRTWHAEAANRFSISFAALPGPFMRCRGTDLTEGDLVCRAAGTDCWHSLSGPSQMAMMSLPADYMFGKREALMSEGGMPRRGTRLVRVAPPIMARLRRLHAATAELAISAPEIIANHDAARGLEASLEEVFADCLVKGQAEEDRSSRRRHELILRKFQTLIEEREGESLYLAEACAALGVSNRTLHQCCFEEFGYGPKRYLLLRRLHLARHALREARPLDASVTEIATRFGFWELGRFAVAYRRQFGEPPSQTLRVGGLAGAGANPARTTADFA